MIDGGEQRVQQRIVQRRRHEDRSRSFAPLPVELREALRQRVGGGADVRVRAHDRGIVAAAFELQRLEILSRRRRDGPPTAAAPRECETADAPVRSEDRADLRLTVQELEQGRRSAVSRNRLRHRHCKEPRCMGCVLGGFQQHGASRSECVCRLLHRGEPRGVEWREDGSRSPRHAQQVGVTARRRQNAFARQLLRVFGGVTHDIGERRGEHRGHRDGHAAVERVREGDGFA